MAEHPVLTVLLAFIVASTVTSPFRYAFKAYNRNLRSKNIQSQGWSPAHLDADGDFKSGAS